ncbi:MAG: HDOD domain-containing protein [Burkholderiaceae bacterium]|nr:HDOD domain-containing protein [Burkholderiaceae bacterium]
MSDDALPELDALLASSAQLPALPRSAALLLAELAHAQPQLRRLNLHFGQDPVLAARLLALANGPAFQMARQVSGIPEALALASAQQLRTLVAAAPLGTAAQAMPGVSLAQFARYSQLTARLARALAGVLLQDQVAAYTVGLLHGLGELLLHLCIPQEMAAIDALVPPLDARRSLVEQQILGYGYEEVSARLAERWRLPARVAEALRYQNDPLAENACEPLAAIVHLASWRMRAHLAKLDEKETADSFPGDVGAIVGLDIDMVLQQDPFDWRGQSSAADVVV